jgi:hypothetical protein
MKERRDVEGSLVRPAYLVLNLAVGGVASTCPQWLELFFHSRGGGQVVVTVNASSSSACRSASLVAKKIQRAK